MADVFSVEKRSDIMSRIKSKNTKPELKMAEVLKDNSIPFKMHVGIIGKPDFILHGMGIALFVDGEFWHGKTLTAAKREILSEFWVNKLDRNMQHDKEVTLALRKIGWCVIRVTDRDVNRRPDWVMSKIWRAHGQLVGKNRKVDPDVRVKALAKTMVKRKKNK